MRKEAGEEIRGGGPGWEGGGMAAAAILSWFILFLVAYTTAE